jgi:hypothetical protein
MRLLVVVLVLAVAHSRPVVADNGYFVYEGLGGAAYRGELAAYDGAPRFHIGFGVRRESSTFELFGAFLVPDAFFIDCYGDECAQLNKPKAGIGALGIDVRRRWRLVSLRRWGKPGVYERPGVFLALHGGPRWFVGNDSLAHHAGPGLGGGAAIEGDLWLIGYYLDFGLDVMRLHGPSGTVRGSTPYIMFGGKLGWL